MTNKFKYLPFQNDESDVAKSLLDLIDDGFAQKVSCPLPFSQLKNGEYMIRGIKKHHRKEYYLLDGVWYLVADVQKDNGNYDCDSSKYLYFPFLSEKEWAKIEAVGFKKLNKIWQRHLLGYRIWCTLRKTERRFSFFFLFGYWKDTIYL